MLYKTASKPLNTARIGQASDGENKEIFADPSKRREREDKARKRQLPTPVQGSGSRLEKNKRRLNSCYVRRLRRLMLDSHAGTVRTVTG